MIPLHRNYSQDANKENKKSEKMSKTKSARRAAAKEAARAEAAKADAERVRHDGEFRIGDTVLFPIRVLEDEAPVRSPYAFVSDGIFKSTKFDLPSLASFVGDETAILSERLNHALKFPTLRPLAPDQSSRRDPFSRGGAAVNISDDCSPEKMIARRRAMAMGCFVFKRFFSNLDLTDVDVERAVKKIKAQILSQKKTGEMDPDQGLYRKSPNHVSRITRGLSTTSFPGLSLEYNVQWTDALNEVSTDKNINLIGLDQIQSVNEWSKSRRRSRGPSSNHWFGLADNDGNVTLDKDLFWSVAFFFQFIGTCGVEDWDKELQCMHQRALNAPSSRWNFFVEPRVEFAAPEGHDDGWRKWKETANTKYKMAEDFGVVLSQYMMCITELEEVLPIDDDYGKSERAKLITNMSATFYKLYELSSNPRNNLKTLIGPCDYKGSDDPLLESYKHAKWAIETYPYWWKGYFYAARALYSNGCSTHLNDILTNINNMLTSATIVHHYQPAKIQEVIDFLVKIKFFTRLEFLKKSPMWKLISYKEDVFVVCPKGAGHFRHPIEAYRVLKKQGRLRSGRGCSLVLRSGQYNMDADISFNKNGYEEFPSNYSEESYLALCKSSSYVQFSAPIILHDGEKLELIGELPAVDSPLYDCGFRGFVEKNYLVTLSTSGRVAQHIFIVQGKKSKLTLTRILVKHFVRHPSNLFPHTSPPSAVRLKGRESNVNILECRFWSAAQPIVHATNGECVFLNSSLLDSAQGFIMDENSVITIKKSFISDISMTAMKGIDCTLIIEDCVINNVGDWDLDCAIFVRGSASRLEVINSDFSNSNLTELSRGAVMMRSGSLRLLHCNFLDFKVPRFNAVINVGEKAALVVERNVFDLRDGDSYDSCALKITNHAAGRVKWNVIKNCYNGIFIQDQLADEDGALEIRDNKMTRMSGSKIVVCELDGHPSIQGVDAKHAEFLSVALTSKMKIEQVKSQMDIFNRRKKFILPQTKDDSTPKEIERLRKMAPLRAEVVKARFHLDRKCVFCRRAEHIHGPSLGSFKMCERCKYRGDLYCCRECQVGHWPIHRLFCKKYKETVKKYEQENM